MFIQKENGKFFPKHFLSLVFYLCGLLTLFFQAVEPELKRMEMVIVTVVKETSLIHRSTRHVVNVQWATSPLKIILHVVIRLFIYKGSVATEDTACGKLVTHL